MGGTGPRAAPLLAILLLVPAAAALSTPALHDQDDAGSGGDAPDRFEEGLEIEPGSYEGQLLTVGNDRTPTPLLDDEDWYRFHAEEGQRIRVVANAPDVPRGSVLFEVRRPDDGLANWTADGYEAEDRETTVVADRTGWWALRVTSSAAGEIPYAFRLNLEDGPPSSIGLGGDGWIATGVQVDPGGTAMLVLGHAFRSTPEDHRADTYVIADGERWISIHKRGNTVPEGGGLQTDDVHVDVHVEAGPSGLSTEWGWIRISAAGVYHIVHLTDARDAYASAHLGPLDEAHPLGTSQGTELTVAHASDFRGTAALDAGPASLTLDARHTMRVDHTLVGDFYCGEDEASRCAVEPPSGERWTLGEEYESTYLVGSDPGIWSFERERSVGSDPIGFNSHLALFAADVDLPGLDLG